MGSSMPRPTDTPLALTAPLFAASPFGLLVINGTRQHASRAEDGNRGPQLGEQPESLDELRLDPHHPPRIGVHPVGGAGPVQQPLVGRGLGYVPAAQRGGPLTARPPARLRVPAHGLSTVALRRRWPGQARGQPLTPWSRRMSFSASFS